MRAQKQTCVHGVHICPLQPSSVLAQGISNTLFSTVVFFKCVMHQQSVCMRVRVGVYVYQPVCVCEMCVCATVFVCE